jgi:hypothetical protein
MRSWPARVVFWTDPTSDSIGATDGSTIARWHPHEKKTEFFAWTDTSTSKTSDVAPDVREKMEKHLDLFRRYQLHYLRALTR